MTSGLAMRMRLELAQLSRRHGVVSGLSCALPLAPPSDRAIIITGIASSNTVDQERMRFRPWSLKNFLSWRPPPLLFRHKEPAGEIEHIGYDKNGRLIIRARVDHPEARRCGGLSIAATIEAYEIRDADDPVNFHALITQASLDEISITPTPCNPNCLITSRLPSSPHNEMFDTAKAAVEKIQQMLRHLEKMQQPKPPVNLCTAHKSKPHLPARNPQPKPPRLAVEPHRQSDFGKLVAALERKTEMEMNHVAS